MQEKIKRTFVREEAYVRIRDGILDGTYAPGTKLKDKELAHELGISRTPVREALLRLEDEGLIQTKPNSATLVSPINFHNALHLYSIVWTLEKLALNEVFESVTDRHIQEMTEANERFLQKVQKHDCLAALDADYEFHSVYVDLSQNNELKKIIFEIKQKLKRLDLYYFDKIQGAAVSYDEHAEIIKALQNKEVESALNAIESNWRNSFLRFNI